MATKTYTYTVISETTVKVVVEVASGGNVDCAGWYVRGGEIVGHVWDDQPSYRLPAHAIVEAMKSLKPTTSQGENMKTLQSDTINVLNSFVKGQGATLDLSHKLLVNDLSVSYLSGVYSFNFANDSHKDAYLTMLMYKELKDKSPDYIERLFKHLGSGEYLSLNHTDGNGQSISVDKYAMYKVLFDSLGITEVKSNGKGSKLTQLICEPTTETVTVLSVNGFSNITPLIDGFQVIGLKVELPKVAE